MEVYTQIILSIIKRQEAIIGPVAVEQAEHIPHLKLNWQSQQVEIEGDPLPVIDNLVHSYSRLFGNSSASPWSSAT
jgi:hypothetical protein